MPVAKIKSSKSTLRPAPRVGEIRRIGKFGPAYVITKISGDTCTVSIPENGQKADLKLSSVIADPIEV